ncbi:MAG TPA: hypothetical protein VN081_05250 [Dongiaceae bacterium]|nr:hypothetical protein [Dongiaceae bacterium]
MTELQPTHEHEVSDYEINTGDTMYVKRNLRDENGAFLRNAHGEIEKKLEDGWEVINLAFHNKQTGEVEVLLQNTANPDELKPVPAWRLREIQDEAEKQFDVESVAPSVAAELIGEIDQHSSEISEEEPRVTRQDAEEIGEEALEAAHIDNPSDAESNGEVEVTAKEVEQTYVLQVANLRDELTEALGKPLSALVEGDDTIKTGERQIAEYLKETADELSQRLNHIEDYPIDAVRTILQQTQGRLHSINGFVSNYDYHTIHDALGALNAVDAIVAERAEAAAIRDRNVKTVLGERQLDQGAFDTDAATTLVAHMQRGIGDMTTMRRELDALQGGTRGLKGEITTIVNTLDAVIKESYSRPINTQSIHDIAQRLRQLAVDGGPLSQRAKSVAGNFESVIANIHHVRQEANGE